MAVADAEVVGEGFFEGFEGFGFALVLEPEGTGLAEFVFEGVGVAELEAAAVGLAVDEGVAVPSVAVEPPRPRASVGAGLAIPGE